MAKLRRFRVITRHGWTVLAGSLLSIVAARLLGSIELFVLGVIGIGLVLTAIAFVRIRRVQIQVARAVTPPRVHAGAPSQVTLTVTNGGNRRTPVVRVTDPVSGTRGANLLVAPLQPGVPARAAYRLPTERRGVVEIGPMQVQVADPFGLASATLPAAGTARLTVYPPVHRLAHLPPTGGADPHAGFEHHRTLTRGGEDFYALRPYVVGDELRRVHWPSSARHDELLVRQDEVPWQGRLTVLLDNSAPADLGERGLDLAATIAASVLAAAHQRGNLVRLVLADGTDSGHLAGNAQVDALLEVLALMKFEPAATLRAAVDRAATTARNGAVVTITAEPDTDGHVLLQRLSRSFASVCSVVIDRSAHDPDAPEGAPAASRRFLRVTRSAPFPDIWTRAMQSQYAGAPA
jgi:uncharacterized protein (DUF58 family)